MRTTIDIADEKYSRLKTEAAVERTTVKALVSEGVDLLLRERQLSRASRPGSRPPWPVIAGGNPAVLARISNDAIFAFDEET